MKADEQKDPTNKRPMKTCDSRTHQCKSLSHDQAIEFCEELFNLYVEAKSSGALQMIIFPKKTSNLINSGLRIKLSQCSPIKKPFLALIYQRNWSILGAG